MASIAIGNGGGSSGGGASTSSPNTWTAMQTLSVVPSAGFPALAVGAGAFTGGASPAFQGTALIGVNAPSGYVGNLIDLQLAGSSGFKVAQNGSTVLSTLTAFTNLIVTAVQVPTAGQPVIRFGSGGFTGGAAPNFQGTSYLGVNLPAGRTENLVDLQIAGVSKFQVDANGSAAVGGLRTETNAPVPTIAAGAASSAVNLDAGSNCFTGGVTGTLNASAAGATNVLTLTFPAGVFSRTPKIFLMSRDFSEWNNIWFTNIGGSATSLTLQLVAGAPAIATNYSFDYMLVG